MYFKEVELKNFRNYKEQKVIFDKKLNLFLGKNAQGKTNLLESLFIMSLGRSFRTNKDQDMIAFGEEASKVRCVVCDEEGGRDSEIEIYYKPEGKIIKINGVKLPRTIDLLEHVYIVVFSPDDLKIIKEGPENRRHFLDRELCQIKPVYYSDLANYRKTLRQRNTLLKERNNDRNLIAVFNDALSHYGIRIVEERERFTERLCEISREIHRGISNGKEKLSISYEASSGNRGLKSREERQLEYKRKLTEGLEGDFDKGYTSFGPHKDDLAIVINDIDIRNFGSQGQQRSAALSMKLAEISLIKQETGKNAILLLDDVLSELDRMRQRQLIESMKDVQVFITSTFIDDEVLSLLPEGKRYNIEAGRVNLLT